MKNFFLLLAGWFLFWGMGHASTTVDSLLIELDQTLEERWRFENQKEQEIEALKVLADQAVGYRQDFENQVLKIGLRPIL